MVLSTRLPKTKEQPAELVLALYSGAVAVQGTNGAVVVVRDTTSRHESSSSSSNSSSMILATSSSFKNNKKVELLLQDDDHRPLLSDRQTTFGHWKPKPLAVSTVRVVAKQAAECLARFLSDKLEQECRADDEIARGKLTVEQADAQVQEWETAEWKVVVQNFPNKAWTAVWKYQAATLLCRLYEALASCVCTTETLDKLTLDVFSQSKRESKQYRDKKTLFQSMLVTCLWANAILYLADFSVHEIILAVGWYEYKKSGRRERAIQDAAAAAANKDDVSLAKQAEQSMKKTAEDSVDKTKSFAKQSSTLLVSRVVGWVGASVGGAIGTLMWPGWGALMGVNMGDSMVASVLEE